MEVHTQSALTGLNWFGGLRVNIAGSKVIIFIERSVKGNHEPLVRKLPGWGGGLYTFVV